MTRIPSSFLVSHAIKVGAKLAPVYVRKTGPDPELDMQIQLTTQPALNQGGGVLLRDWIPGMERLVSDLLKELSEPPPNLLARLTS